MDKQKGPTGFIVVLPGEVIEIPQDSDKSWLTLFYSLLIIPGISEPPVRTLRATIPENERHIFR